MKHNTAVHRQVEFFQGSSLFVADVTISCMVQLFEDDENEIVGGMHFITDAVVDEVILSVNGRDIRAKIEELDHNDIIAVYQEISNYIDGNRLNIIDEAMGKVLSIA